MEIIDFGISSNIIYFALILCVSILQNCWRFIDDGDYVIYNPVNVFVMRLLGYNINYFNHRYIKNCNTNSDGTIGIIIVLALNFIVPILLYYAGDYGIIIVLFAPILLSIRYIRRSFKLKKG